MAGKAVEYINAEIVAVPSTSDAVGRHDLYEIIIRPNLDYIENAVSQGMTEQSIYNKLGISHQTWITYKDKHLELFDTIMRGRTAAGQLVLHRQFSKACGEVKTITKQKATATGIVDLKEEVYIPPDTNAAEFWGRHLMPDYKSPKTDSNPILIQNNFQLPQLQADIKQLEEELKALESHEPVASQGMED